MSEEVTSPRIRKTLEEEINLSIPESSESASVLGLINGVASRLRLNPFKAKCFRSLGSWIRTLLSPGPKRNGNDKTRERDREERNGNNRTRERDREERNGKDKDREGDRARDKDKGNDQDRDIDKDKERDYDRDKRECKPNDEREKDKEQEWSRRSISRPEMHRDEQVREKSWGEEFKEREWGKEFRERDRENR
ncbi:hypothetical protein TEA_008279 [Camellia sinensis var. sinensis]|uniref:Uncharacterized protein n=1 Tax=Camellia sinensis var. sinensis TaxID=542762 RepID=A0A4S4DD89_CAMSN|nr:hypothetical protein TEA_008279 [Camellia sinensis var. sinensis]